MSAKPRPGTERSSLRPVAAAWVQRGLRLGGYASSGANGSANSSGQAPG